MSDTPEKDAQEWRECAEKLAKALHAEWMRRSLIGYVDANEALAEFARLKGETPDE
jgi:hypothetical protein